MQNLNESAKMQYVAATIAPGLTSTLLGITKLIEIFLSWLCLPVELFVRFRFGERYLTILRILVAWGAFQLFRTFYYVIGGLLGFVSNAGLSTWFTGGYDFRNLFNNSPSSMIYVLFVYALWGLSLLHLLSIWKGNAEGEIWHSYSFGVSWFEFLPWKTWDRVVSLIPIRWVSESLKVNDWTLYRFVEPAFCFLVAAQLTEIDAMLGTWLTVASVALLLRNWVAYFEMRGRALDTVDGQIESRYMEASLNGANKRKTAGYSVAPAPHFAAFQSFDIDRQKTLQETLGWVDGKKNKSATEPLVEPLVEGAK